jgi:hypothetical protein
MIVACIEVPKLTFRQKWVKLGLDIVTCKVQLYIGIQLVQYLTIVDNYRLKDKN